MTARQRKRQRFDEILTKREREIQKKREDDLALRRIQRETPCRFWKLGRCKAGLECPFLHAAGAQRRIDVVCKHFNSRNGCDRGNACLFRHVMQPSNPGICVDRDHNIGRNGEHSSFSTQDLSGTGTGARPRETLLYVAQTRTSGLNWPIEVDGDGRHQPNPQVDDRLVPPPHGERDSIYARQTDLTTAQGASIVATGTGPPASSSDSEDGDFEDEGQQLGSIFDDMAP